MKLKYSKNCLSLLLAGMMLLPPGSMQARDKTTTQTSLVAEDAPDQAIKLKQAPNKPEEEALLSSKYSVPHKRTRKIDPFKKEQSKELLRYSAQLGLGVGLIGGIYYLIGGSKPLDPSLIMGPLIANMLSKPLGDIGNKLCLLFIPAFAKPAMRRAIDLKKQYTKQKAKFDPSMQSFLEAGIQRYTFLIENYDYRDIKQEKAIEELLEFPGGPKPIKPEIVPITTFLKSYPEEVRLAVGDFVVQTITDSKSRKLNKKAVPLMFVGPPGTGKTYLATQLGDLLGLPVQVIDLSKYKNVGGNSFWSEDPDRGVIVDALLRGQEQGTHFANKILILDEVDKVLAKDKNGVFLHKSGAEVSSLLHSLLETQETAARLARYDGATHDISQLKIILAANRTFSEVLGQEDAASLESRVSLVKFTDGFSEIQKLAIAQKHVTKRCQQQGLAYDQVDQNIVESIVQADTKAGYKGVRVLLKVIDQYVRTLEQGELIGEIAGLPPVKFDVQKAYEKAKP
jgi:hypothetical protein